MSCGYVQYGLSRPSLLTAVWFLAIAAAAAPPTSAQLSNLDPAVLIDGLARQGMSELLMHLAESESFDDPLVASHIKIAQQRVQYGETRRPVQERVGALDRAIEGLRQLIDSPPDPAGGIFS